MEPVTVVLHSRRQKRASAVQKLQHLVPAVILLGAGWSALRAEHATGAESAIALFEVVSGALFLFATARVVRNAARRHPSAPAHQHAHAPAHAPDPSHAHAPHGIDWTDVFAAAVVFAETVEHYHRTGHIVRPNVLMIVVLLAMAVFHGRIVRFSQRRRALRISDEGIRIGGRPFRRGIHAPWSAIRAIDVADRFASIALKDGLTKLIDFRDLENDGPVRVALRMAQERLAAMALS